MSDIYYKFDGSTLHLSPTNTEGALLTNQPKLYPSFTSPDGWGWATDNHGLTCRDITKVVIDDPIQPLTCCGMFADMLNLTEIEGLENLDTSQVTNMCSMFASCHNLTNLDLSSLDVSHVKNVAQMFQGCSDLKSLVLSGWDVSSLDCMTHMFAYCRRLRNIDFHGWEVNHALVDENPWEDGGIFQGCDDIGTAAVEQIATNPPVFYKYVDDELHLRHEVAGGEGWTYCTPGDRGIDDDLPSPSKVVIEDKVILPPDASYYFAGLAELTEIEGLSNLDTSQVTSMYCMFADCEKLKSLDLSGWDVSKVWTIKAMFEDCYDLVAVNLDGWQPNRLVSHDCLFLDCSSLQSVTTADQRIIAELPDGVSVEAPTTQAPTMADEASRAVSIEGGPSEPKPQTR